MPQILSTTNTNIKKVVQQLQNNHLAVIPTETVYGLAGNAYSDYCIKKIYTLKQRAPSNPLIVHFNNIQSVSNDFILTSFESKIAQLFWPGPLSIILNRRPECKVSHLCSQYNLQAVRISNNSILNNIIDQTGFPLAAPSANISNAVTGVTPAQIAQNFENDNELIILDNGRSQLGLESTVVRCLVDSVQILRVGSIAIEEFQKQNIKISNLKELKALSPGMSTKHYSPKARLILNANKAKPNSALLAFGKIPESLSAVTPVLNLSPTQNLQEASYNLFHMLWQLDLNNVDYILVTQIPNTGLGVSINDRLFRASKHN